MTALEQFSSDALWLDLEASSDRIHAIGAIRGERTLRRHGRFPLAAALGELDRLADGAPVLAGHNLLHHDLPILRALAPRLRLLRTPVVDTLYLSPLAFPQHPYHALVKDYKLVRDALNDPVADARLAARLFADEWAAFRNLRETRPTLLSFYRFCLESEGLPDAGRRGFAAFFDALGAPAPAPNAAEASFRRLAAPHGCRTAVTTAFGALAPECRILAAYALAWLRVSGSNSVLPAWTRHQFPDLVPFLRRLRDAPCADPDCAYCRTTHDPRAQLKKYFGFDAFRPQPATPDGHSLQGQIVAAGLTDAPLLAILATGAGKSLCFQLPALARNFRRGVLTLVISPLQALMKDQVDNLAAKTGLLNSGALNGLLTPPERGEMLERIRKGDLAILYVSPEQLRNKSFRDAVRQREIGAWIFDEAHCLSKWGHDFRPDYLYAARFIREFAAEQGVPVPPVACFTATAKQDVAEEILEHMRREVGQELQLFRGDAERGNLAFEVQMVAAPEKWGRIHEILSERLPGTAGSAVVYVATRNGAELIANFLRSKGWEAAAFHAGLDAPDKRRIQDDFIAGRMRVICATNAFGMGIDKENVRLVLHADIPGSLENYVQEAGRAGRDQAPAQCVLLYDEHDIETQFGLGAFSRLSQRDIVEILRGLRRARRNEKGEIVLTAGELLRDEAVHAGFGSGDPGADTKVRTAIAVLEKAGFVERNQNHTRVFQGRPLVRNLEEARRRIAELNLSPRRQEQWLEVLQLLMNAPPDEGMSADVLAELPVFRGETAAAVRETGPEWGRRAAAESDTTRVLRTLNEMADAGLIKKDLQMTAFVRPKGPRSSRRAFDAICALEKAMLDALREEAPDPEGWLALSVRRLNQRLTDEGHATTPQVLLRLLQALSLDGPGGSLELRALARDHYRAKLRRDWATTVAFAERRRAFAGLALDTLLQKVPPEAAGETLVAFSGDDVARALSEDLVLGRQIRDRQAALEHALMYLHEQGVVILQQGLAIFRQAMTIRILPGRSGDRFNRGDYSALEHHYEERVFQVHVMNEYARLGMDKIRQALTFVAAYFTLGREEFARRYFAGRKEVVERATSAESYRRIVDALRNPSQVSVVAAKEEENMLVLAGPGSGKTRVVAHRCAWLLRVARVPARGLLVLCFNRNAALALRRRLADLVGPDARGVTVQTYHGLALRLLGASFAERAGRGRGEPPDFDELIVRAGALLRGELDLPGLEPDELRERLLAGCRHILVDEYQDIDARQYELVSAIAGRTLADPDGKLSILAVGDDDQNIYTFRGANVEFLRRFEKDYAARPHYLLENYRSTAHIVAASNQLIARNCDRMKTDRPLRVNAARQLDPPGGRWTRFDPVAQGRVQILAVEDLAAQAAALVREVQRLRALRPELPWTAFAVLARTREELAPLRALCEHHGLPVTWNDDPKKLPPLHRIREIAALLDEWKSAAAAPCRAAALIEQAEPCCGGRKDHPWLRLLREVLVEYREETGDAEQPAGVATEFLYEALAERRREHATGAGIFLSTVHAAKGMEFPHVFIPGGGWQARGGAEEEEERRVYYVGMTRARETLCLFERRDAAPAFTRELDGDFILRRPGVADLETPEAVLARRYDQLGLADVFLDWAGQCPPDAPVHQLIATLQPGDELRPRLVGRSLELTRGDNPVIVLSQAAAELWRPRLNQIERIRVTAVVRRFREDAADPDAARPLRTDRWEIPLAEIVWRPDRRAGP